MSYVIEGTWEEIKLHEDELAGHRFRLIPLIDAEADSDSRQINEVTEPMKQPKVLRGRGMLAGMGSVEDYLRRKQEDIEIEDRPRI